MAGITKSYKVAADGMDLEATLFCGQSFAWQRQEDGLFAGVAGTRGLLAAQQGDELILSNPGGGTLSDEDLAFWRNYFDLDRDYGALLDRFRGDGALAACVAHAGGIRVLRQPFWDTLLSFLLSQNNHIPRITAIAKRLREEFGEALPGGLHAFPAPERLAPLAVEDLAGLQAGYRAKYLLDAARRVAGGQLSGQALAALSDSAAREMLMAISGVGPKVADCVLLYGLGRRDVVPMDVWIKRAMDRLFPGGMPSCAAGEAGLAQQYIFCWARDNLPK